MKKYDVKYEYNEDACGWVGGWVGGGEGLRAGVGAESSAGKPDQILNQEYCVKYIVSE